MHSAIQEEKAHFVVTHGAEVDRGEHQRYFRRMIRVSWWVRDDEVL